MSNMELAEINVVTDGGPWAFHNMPCSVCRQEKAVLELGSGTFQPCWKCQKDGWKTVKKRENRMKKLLMLGLCGALAFFLVTIYVAPTTIGQEYEIEKWDGNKFVVQTWDWKSELVGLYREYSAECDIDTTWCNKTSYWPILAKRYKVKRVKLDSIYVLSLRPTFPGFMQFMEKKYGEN